MEQLLDGKIKNDGIKCIFFKINLPEFFTVFNIFLGEMQVTSIFKNPNIYLPRNSGKNAPSDEVDTIQRVVDTVIDHSSSGDSNCKNVHKTNVETIIALDNNRTVDLRKLSLADEAGPSQRLFEKADVTYKSVHSRYPHASPHRLPRKRTRALNREGSVDSQQDSQQQLNQYKVLNEIGKVRLKFS